MLNKKESGFTLIECIVVIVIIGIVVLMWGMYNRESQKLAMINEARMLVDKIITQEKMFFAKNLRFISIGSSSNKVTKSNDLFVDLSTNEYFGSFYISGGGAYHQYTTDGRNSKSNKPSNWSQYHNCGYYTLNIYLFPKEDKIKDVKEYSATFNSRTGVVTYTEKYV